MNSAATSATRAAKRMLNRAVELGITSASGNPLVVDMMQELLAASAGFRNRHAYKAALLSRETPALEQENPEEANNDYRLVEGKGVWLKMGQFSVHPFLTETGIFIEVFAATAESDPIASLEATSEDAEYALLLHLGLLDNMSELIDWVRVTKGKDFEKAPAVLRGAFITEFANQKLK